MQKRMETTISIGLYTLFPNNQGQQTIHFIIETPKGMPKSLKFFYWLSKYRADITKELAPSDFAFVKVHSG